MAKVFISYVREDKVYIDRLVADLERNGVDVWVDRKKIKPGYRWADAIRQGIAEGDFFIACFSKNYNSRTRSYMNEELTLAVEELRQRSIDQAWFIPVRLSDCAIPARDIGGGETLRSLQWVDLFEDWADGINRILSVVRPQKEPLTVNAGDVAIFAHQLRQPLLAINHYLKAIRRETFSDERKREHMANEVEGLSEMVMHQVRGFQSFLNLLQDEFRLFRSDTSLGREIERLLHFMAPIARQQGVQIDVRGLHRLPRHIRADSTMVGQLLYIMLDNAIKYSVRQAVRRGHFPVLVDASRSIPSKAVLKFVNRGIKIHPDETESIFQMGYRGRDAIRVGTLGTGRGLFLAKRIVNAHGGEIFYRTDDNADLNIFVVTLPADSPDS